MNRYLNIKYLKDIVKRFFPMIVDFDWLEEILSDFVEDVGVLFKSGGMSSSQLAVLMHDLNRYVVLKNILSDEDEKRSNTMFREYVLKEFGSYVSPNVELERGVVFKGNNIIIEGNYKICSECVFYDNVFIFGDNMHNNGNNIYIIDKKCVFKNNTIVINSNIGKEVVVENNCVVRENLDDKSHVKIINQLQITERKNTYIPSQELVIYGVVPKYKNKITVYGEGIYNPNVLLRIGDKKYYILEIEYWDKNKIILRLRIDKSTSSKILEDVKKCTIDSKVKIVIMSRGIKNTINDQGVLLKLLKNI